MGKLFDERVVEYAYINRIIIDNNVNNSNPENINVSIRMSIRYDVKDSNGIGIGTRDCNHVLYSGDELKTAKQISVMVCDNLENFVLADKEELSGYIPEESVPEEQPSTPEEPAPEEQPSTPEESVPEEQPSTPEEPAPEEQPSTPEEPIIP